MREKDIEQKIVADVRSRGGMCPKWVSPGLSGVPDRIVLMPGGRIGFIEAKAPGEKPGKLQVAMHRRLRGLGFKVFVIDSMEQINTALDEIGGRNESNENE